MKRSYPPIFRKSGYAAYPIIERSVTMAELAVRLNRSPRYIKKMLKAHKIRPLRLSTKRLRYCYSQVVQFIKPLKARCKKGAQ